MQYPSEPLKQIEEHHWNGFYQVREIFQTIQGEGPFTGHRAIFIRMTGCHLQCTFCDTKWDNQNDMNLYGQEVYSEVYKLIAERLDYNPLVVITGGEPCRQPLHQLITYLNKFHPIRIQIETTGTFYQDWMKSNNVTLVVSPKTPKIHYKVKILNPYYKYIISAKDTFDEELGIPITSTQPGDLRKARLAFPDIVDQSKIYLSPCEGPDEDLSANYAKIAELTLKYGYIASVRLHTIYGLR